MIKHATSELCIMNADLDTSEMRMRHEEGRLFVALGLLVIAASLTFGAVWLLWHLDVLR